MSERDRARNHPALLDEGTGLANRLQFDLVYDYLFLAGQRGLSFTVLVASAGVDADEGDDAIRTAATAFDKRTRQADLVSHLGGGRFVALLVGTNLQGARIVADRIESAWEQVTPGPTSFGVVAYTREVAGPESLLEQALVALRAAEKSGGGIEFAT